MLFIVVTAGLFWGISLAVKRKLNLVHKARASEHLGIAFSKHRASRKLIDIGENVAAVHSLYYAAYHAAISACIELGNGKTHAFWKGKFNHEFGQGKGWVPKSYTKLLNDLYDARNKADYHGTLPDNPELISQWELKVSLLLKKVRANTPLTLYPEFIQHLVPRMAFSKKTVFIEAFEFDYYCPKSYIHKERLQFQVMAEKFTQKTTAKLKAGGSFTMKQLNASRKEEYVLGWNNRLGQSADGYLLFLDIDDSDEGAVKSALKSKKGWLFKTGDGFHFVGAEVYPSIKSWQHRYTQAANSTKLKKLVDKRHVDFSLRRGYSTLRIDKSLSKDFLPFMCWDNSD